MTDQTRHLLEAHHCRVVVVIAATSHCSYRCCIAERPLRCACYPSRDRDHPPRYCRPHGNGVVGCTRCGEEARHCDADVGVGGGPAGHGGADDSDDRSYWTFELDRIFGFFAGGSPSRILESVVTGLGDG